VHGRNRAVSLCRRHAPSSSQLGLPPDTACCASRCRLTSVLWHGHHRDSGQRTLSGCRSTRALSVLLRTRHVAAVRHLSRWQALPLPPLLVQSGELVAQVTHGGGQGRPGRPTQRRHRPLPRIRKQLALTASAGHRRRRRLPRFTAPGGPAGRVMGRRGGPQPPVGNRRAAPWRSSRESSRSFPTVSWRACGCWCRATRTAGPCRCRA
jgi:hypothetical protein